MYKFKQIVRRLLSNLRISALLIVSLVIGITTFMLVMAKVSYNRSFDKHFEKHENIYRIVSSEYANNELVISQPRCQKGLGSAVKLKNPNILQTGFLCKSIENHFKVEEILFESDYGLHCSSELLELLEFKIISGDKSNLLMRPNMAIVSESFAHKYFGDDDPIGEIIHQYPAHTYEIEAVYADLPSNTHFKADFLLSFHSDMRLPPPLKNDWGELGFYTYVKLSENAALVTVEREMNSIGKEQNQVALNKTNGRYEFKLQPVADIRTKSDLKNELAVNVKGRYLSILQLIAILIMVVCGFNYVYFSQVKIQASSVQYGVKKVLGVTNKGLFVEFLTESTIIHLLSLVFSLVLIVLLKYFSLEAFLLEGVDSLPVNFWVSIVSVLIGSAVLNTIVLFLMVTNVNALAMLTKHKQNIRSAFSFRKVLTVVQFVIIMFLISSVLGIGKQISFLKNKDQGIELSNKFVIKTPSHLRRTSNRVKNIESFEQELLKIPGVENFTISNVVPGDIPSFGFNVTEQVNNKKVKSALFIADNNFMKAYGINVIEGDGLSDKSNGCIINESCLKMLGVTKVDDVLGRKLLLEDESGFQKIETFVSGVCADFNFSSAKEKPSPIVILDWTKNMLWGNYTLTVNSGTENAFLINRVKKLYDKTFPNYPFQYFWNEDFYNQQFAQEASISENLKNFTLIAVLLGLLSLFSMALHVSLARTKEISIRKINGAKNREIVYMLNIDFLKWIGLASVLAVPLSWYFLRMWLSSFVYKADIGIWVFVISITSAFVLGLITISWQSVRAASMNPVESIKYE